jgi:hypothetical protein
MTHLATLPSTFLRLGRRQEPVTLATLARGKAGLAGALHDAAFVGILTTVGARRYIETLPTSFVANLAGDRIGRIHAGTRDGQ